MNKIKELSINAKIIQIMILEECLPKISLFQPAIYSPFKSCWRNVQTVNH